MRGGGLWVVAVAVLVGASMVGGARASLARRLHRGLRPLVEKHAPALRERLGGAHALRERLRGGVVAGGAYPGPPAGVNCTQVLLCDWAEEIPTDNPFCRNVCAAGSVQIPAYHNLSLATQRALQFDLPLNWATLYGTHNSFVTYADALSLEDAWIDATFIQPLWPNASDNQFVSANQDLSVLDQMNFGIRQVELDVHYHDYAIRLCHAGGVGDPAIDQILEWIAALENSTAQYLTETLGCFASNEGDGSREWPLSQALAQIADWLALERNANEVLVLMFDDQETLLDPFQQIGNLVGNISQYLGADVVFSPDDKMRLFPDPAPWQPLWPSARALVALGKRVVFTSGEDYGPEMYPLVFPKYGQYPLNVANWTEFSPEDVGPFPACPMSGSSFELNQGYIARIFGDRVMYGPLYDPTDLINATRFGELVRCGVNFPCLDGATPQIVEGGIWTWDTTVNATVARALADIAAQHAAHHAPDPLALQAVAGLCPAAQASNGRWTLFPCAHPLPVACAVNASAHFTTARPDGVVSDAAAWRVGAAMPWQAASASPAGLCGAGTVFAVPSTPRAATFLADSIPANATYVWLNYNPAIAP
jgi:hypothetical protein